jgi:glycosyltransferase involved in cell wall biosynthesis
MSDVTIVCATRNGADAVRLTFDSFRRFTPEPHRVVVADNGSVDGTREFLESLPWIELHRRRVGRHALSHGATLDWLVRRVTTKYVLTLDSDVAFRQPGWLGELRRALERSGAAAVGEFEAGVGGYRPRLSPAVCLLETERIRALRCSFRSYVRFRDPEEALRWRTSRAPGENVSYEFLASFTSGVFYSTGARLFERLEETGTPWVTTPTTTRRKYLHIGHMSWAGEDAYLPEQHSAKLAYIREASAPPFP